MYTFLFILMFYYLVFHGQYVPINSMDTLVEEKHRRIKGWRGEERGSKKGKRKKYMFVEIR